MSAEAREVTKIGEAVRVVVIATLKHGNPKLKTEAEHTTTDFQRTFTNKIPFIVHSILMRQDYSLPKIRKSQIQSKEEIALVWPRVCS